tara:strand:- start:1589 stop:1831 length:243 start_codon:yes stop_codon:yes gene_type:complete
MGKTLNKTERQKKEHGKRQKRVEDYMSELSKVELDICKWEKLCRKGEMNYENLSVLKSKLHGLKIARRVLKGKIEKNSLY